MVELNYRSLFESMPGLYLALAPNSPTFPVVAVSDAYLEATRTRREDILGRSVFEALPGNLSGSVTGNVPDLQASLEAVLKNRTAIKIEFQEYFIPRPPSEEEGFEERCCHLLFSPVLGTQGEITYILHCIEDVTESEVIRAHNEVRLQEHQRLLQQVTDTVPGILYVYDLIEQHNVYVNGQVTELLGYTPEQVQSMGMSLFPLLLHPDDLATLPQHICQFYNLKDGEVLEKEYRMRDMEGEWHWFSGREIVFSRTAQGTPKQILGTAYEISDRKRAEAAFHAEKDRFQLAAAAVDCMIYDWNVETSLVERTEGLTRIFGYLPEETEPTRDWWIAHIHPDDLPFVRDLVAANLANGNRYAVEYRVQSKSGQYVYVLDQGFVTRNPTGRPVRVVGTTTDISDRKITEKLQQFLLELHDLIQMLHDPQEVLWIVECTVGNYFNATRCFYGDVDADQENLTVDRDFYNGVIGIAGSHRLDNFGAEFVSLLKQGRTLIVEDTQKDKRVDQTTFARFKARAVLCVPLLHLDQLIGLFMIQDQQPRNWTTEEIALIEEVADRAWTAISKARTEKALRQSEARFQRLATNVPGVIFRYLVHRDGSDAMPYISASCRTVFELDYEVVQQNVDALWNLICLEDLESLREIIAISAQTEQPIHWEGRFVMPSGQTKWIQLVSRPERQLDGSVLWDGLLTDITSTKEIEAEREQLLGQSQQYANQLRGLTEAALVMNSMLSVEEVLQVITDQAHAIIGTHQASTSLVIDQNWAEAVHAIYLSDKYAAWLNYNAEPDGSGIYASICQLNRPLRMTQAELETHPRWRGFGGQATHHPPLRGWLAAPLMGRNGQNIGFIQLSDKYQGEFTASDEDILVQLAQMASVAIENSRLYKAEKIARTQAEAANRIKDEFLAVLSHELRSPLNPILGWSRLLQNRKLDQRTTAHALETIERNAKLQTQLIEDLLDVSRILQGKLNLNVGAVNLVTIMEAAMETVRLAAEAKAIDVRFEIVDSGLEAPAQNEASSGMGEVIQTSTLNPHDSQFQISGDPNRLQQIVWNLLSNAVKFTPFGGRVDIRLERVEAEDGGMEDSPETNIQNSPLPSATPFPTPYVQVTIRDTGKGIAPHFLPYIFDYFRQEDGAMTRRFGGLGLGLAIVRHLVELHGGMVRAASPGENQGSVFVIKLPILQTVNEPSQQEQTPPPPLTPQPLPLSNLHILVADDDVDSRELIGFVLEKAGAHVTVVDSAREVLRVLVRQEIDVLISDIGMPEIDGYALLGQIRALFPNSKRNMPAIALTTYAGEFNQQEALRVGFQTHLTKPIEPAELIQAVATLVGR
ncbi:PAS domain-containing protein [Kovacikia minuta CCNUW1]|uniref:PAS domain-containing protein n=1 Tax=Kovacikia minuta TaxID=2931930 RepID=UPI001CCFD011|nr:PAS domain-containing protein [Kovacikia minuta]UBF25848.1 PAS domain-containing protein [Kovacikia minuta CCNUW1]